MIFTHYMFILDMKSGLFLTFSKLYSESFIFEEVKIFYSHCSLYNTSFSLCFHVRGIFQGFMPLNIIGDVAMFLVLTLVLILAGGI